jgi:cAMP-specific phosphodiesterase 4
MLNKELSHLSESSKSGNQISEYICSTFLGNNYSNYSENESLPSISKIYEFQYKINVDKQQEVDVDESQPQQGAPSTSGNPTRTRSPRTMSQISGYKRPLMHTNSFTSDKLPLHGVETSHELALGAMLNDINTWGIDIFKIGTLSCNRPLTCVAYQIIQVRNHIPLPFHSLFLHLL